MIFPRYVSFFLVTLSLCSTGTFFAQENSDGVYTAIDLTRKPLVVSIEESGKGQDFVEPSAEISLFIEKINKLLDEDFPSDEVLRLLENEAPTLAQLEPYIFFSDKGYMRNLIHKTADYDLLLMCWGPGQQTPVHGHEGQRGWIRVIDGKLEFTDYQEEPEGSDKLVSEVGVNVGEAGNAGGPAGIHVVANVFDTPAISLHFYSLPFDQCEVYDLELNETRKVPLVYNTIRGKMMQP